MEENLIQVYAKIDENNVITNINSSIFLPDATGYVVIDAGNGDKFAHAQSQYFEKGLTDFAGKFNFKLVEGEVIEITDTEKEVLFPTPVAQPTEIEVVQEKVATLETENATINYALMMGGLL